MLGITYGNPKQARKFVHFIAEELRKELVCTLQEVDFFGVCVDSSTDKGTIDGANGDNIPSLSDLLFVS